MLLSLVLLLAALVLTGFGASTCAPLVVRHMHPGLATMLLTIFAVTVALATETILLLVGYIGTADILPAAHPSDWSRTLIRSALPIPTVVAIGAGLVAIAVAARAVVHVVEIVRSSRYTAAAATELSAAGDAAGDLVIVRDPAVDAYAVPGRGGRVVVTTGMLQALSASERRALLAHEYAHLRHHHYGYAQLARLAAIANPLLRPVGRAVDQTIERWADRVAVQEVGDPAVVARAIGAAALAGSGVRRPGALGAARDDVVGRVQELLEPRGRRLGAGVAFACATVLTWAGLLLVALYAYGIVEAAETAGS